MSYRAWERRVRQTFLAPSKTFVVTETGSPHLTQPEFKQEAVVRETELGHTEMVKRNLALLFLLDN